MEAFEQQFIDKVTPGAIACQHATGVPAAITIAQAILESGWGKSRLALECNNFFGIKATAADIAAEHYKEYDTKEQVGQTLETIKAEFAQYATVEDCFVAHGQLLLHPRYAPAMKVAGNVDLFAYMLGPKTPAHPTACDYSTLVEYHDRLMALVHQHSLGS